MEGHISMVKIEEPEEKEQHLQVECPLTISSINDSNLMPLNPQCGFWLYSNIFYPWQFTWSTIHYKFEYFSLSKNEPMKYKLYNYLNNVLKTCKKGNISKRWKTEIDPNNVSWGMSYGWSFWSIFIIVGCDFIWKYVNVSFDQKWQPLISYCW